MVAIVTLPLALAAQEGLVKVIAPAARPKVTSDSDTGPPGGEGRH
jgi:hypothetical protein